ncbi:unnamed protein product [Trichobilharzia szidati]|nr:unnamed protein product [Trichobilharzia szidati]
MPLPSAESPSQLESSNAPANSSNLCMIVDMPSSKGATKPSSSNIPPTFNIANILSPETQTETSRSRQNGDDTEINQPILNNRESTPVEAQNITPTVSEADSNHVNNNNYNNSDSDMSLVVLSSETSSNETSFDTTIQIDDSVTSDGERKNESNQNVSVIPSHSRDRTAGDSSDTQIAMDALMDALKYHDAQVKLQQAEKAITDLLMKFAEPQDCSPLFDMLANSSILDKTDSDSNEANYSNDIVSPSSVLPILNLLKSQSDPQRSSDLNESSSYGKQLYDLYSPCVFDILRIKLKLYILNKMRLRQSKENGTFSITSTSQSIITTTTVTANTNSSYRDASSPTKYSSHSPVTNNQNNPENAFITYSNNVQNTIEIQANKRDSSCHSVEQSKPPESIINDEERMVTRLQSNNGDVDADQFTNSVYTNPYHCPLSLLSLVCELEQYREGKHRQGSVMSSERNDSATDNTTETTPSSVIPRDDCSSSGGTNNPLSTPEIRRNELDLSDLSDGTRVLVIKDTYLLPGTIYMEGDHSPLAIQTSLSSDCLRDQVFRIHLDSEKCNRSTGLRVATDNHFTTSSHSNNTNGTSSRRQSSSLSSPSGCLQTPSTTSNTNCGNTLSGSNRRRQMDLLLYGWQVVQQAVPEVFPASIDHVPPGTRVCAAWSDKLGVNLYPGTVAKADSPEDVNRDLVPVDFDDGDHREVPVSGLRILPDYFTNLCELANVTGGEPNIMNGLISSNSVNSVSNAFVSRMRRHSGVDRTIRRLSNHSWSLSETPISLCSSQASTTSVANSTSSLLEDNSYNPNPRVSRTKSFEICGFSNSSDITMGYSVDSGESISDPICIPRAVKTPIVSAPWSILEKYKHRKRRCTYCRSIIRNVDGLVVELGDCVQLRSDGDELYLGKVREIRYNGEKHSPTVVTSWYYEPREAGEDGQLVQHVKGAVFATEHEDENGAECIIRLVKMAKSYGEFLQSCGRRRDDLKILSTDKVSFIYTHTYIHAHMHTCIHSIFLMCRNF